MRGVGGGGVIWRTTTDSGHCCEASTSHVLASGTPESPSIPRLHPLQAGGQFGLFVFKQHLLLSNNKGNQNNTGQVQLCADGWNNGNGVSGLHFLHAAHTNLNNVLLNVSPPPFLVGDTV